MEAEKISLAEINNGIKSNLDSYITACENAYIAQVKEVAQNTINKGAKFILLAGPSSSGKTTSSKILANTLAENGYKAMPLSLDDFFVEREQTPKWEDGTYNYETADAIDWVLFGKCVKSLLEGKSVKLPTYNFATGSKYFDAETTITQNTIVVIEGLHALNPIIDKYIPKNKSYKVYISLNTDVYQNGKPFLRHETIRQYRRIIRDLYTRSTSIAKTLEMWRQVLTGEALYIDPFVDSVEYKINSFHPYEICVYKSIFDSLINHDKEIPNILKKLEPVHELSKQAVPSTSVLQEFIPQNN